MKKFFLYIALSISLLMPPAHAEEQKISKQQAISIAQQQHPGRVLSVKLKADSYLVKVLDKQGTVRVIRVNRSNGKASRRD